MRKKKFCSFKQFFDGTTKKRFATSSNLFASSSDLIWAKRKQIQNGWLQLLNCWMPSLLLLLTRAMWAAVPLVKLVNKFFKNAHMGLGEWTFLNVNSLLCNFWWIFCFEWRKRSKKNFFNKKGTTASFGNWRQLKLIVEIKFVMRADSFGTSPTPYPSLPRQICKVSAAIRFVKTHTY